MAVSFAARDAMAAKRRGRSNCQGDDRLVVGAVREAVDAAGTRRFIVGLVTIFVTVVHARIPFVKRLFNAAD